MSTVNIFFEIERLVKYAFDNELIENLDIILTRNLLLDLFKVEKPYEGTIIVTENLTEATDVLKNMLDYAFEIGMLENNSDTFRDLLDAKIMGILIPRQSYVANKFWNIANNRGTEDATKWYYDFSQKSNYIRMDRIRKNMHWYSPTKFGNLEITVNLSKPEKDPKAIAAAKNVKQDKYPKCLLCVENVGYAGRLDHFARQNHRIVPFRINGEAWSLQYSPYVYFNEHCIVLSNEHKPMKIEEETFRKMLDFIDQVPHYFIGSNADLPIVGGSILSHDHFQGGNHDFPMAKALVEKEFISKKYSDVKIGIVKWPMSVIRINAKDRKTIINIATEILNKWRNYTDESLGIFAKTDGIPHNTITPIARKRGDEFELDLVLRNNRTSVENPLGIFHPHSDLHHIKKENIGLIEVMGLAVLPGRLKEEMKYVTKILTGELPFEREAFEKNEMLAKHIDWMQRLANEFGIKNSIDQANKIIKDSVGLIFSKVLEDAGVYKRDEIGQAGLDKFMMTFI